MDSITAVIKLVAAIVALVREAVACVRACGSHKKEGR